MKELSRIVSVVQASTTMAIDAMFKQMKADSVGMVGFGARGSDFSIPDNIKAAGIMATRQSVTRYIPAAGTVELRQAAYSRVKVDYGLEYKPSQVVVSSSAKYLVYLTLRAVANPGDEIILPAPYRMSYIELTRMVGDVPVVVTAIETEYFKLTAERFLTVITPRVKAILLSSPSNPAGMMYDREELETTTAVCTQTDIYVTPDEIYTCLAYGGHTFASFAFFNVDAKGRTILVDGVSKAYAMTSRHIGYACASDVITRVMANYVSHPTGSPIAIPQRAAAVALSGSQVETETMRQAFEQHCNYIAERVNAIPGVNCIQPEGALYVVMNLEQLLGKTIHRVEITSGDVFTDAFLKYGLVAIVPSPGFRAPNFTRWSYATSMENIREGLDHLEKFLAE